MTKLVALSKLVAEVADITPARARVHEMVLRKNGLITTGGRGLYAAEMTPRDATNLILAALDQGAATEAHEGVSKLRRLPFEEMDVENYDEDTPKRYYRGEDVTAEDLPFDMIKTSTLGDALDWAFGNPHCFENSYSELSLVENSYSTFVTLSLAEEGWFEGSGFQTDAKKWALEFKVPGPKQKYHCTRSTRFSGEGLRDIALKVTGGDL